MYSPRKDLKHLTQRFIIRRPAHQSKAPWDAIDTIESHDYNQLKRNALIINLHIIKGYESRVSLQDRPF